MRRRHRTDYAYRKVRYQPRAPGYTAKLALACCIIFQIFIPSTSHGQTLASAAELPVAVASGDLPFSSRNTWSIFGEFSPNSHHWVLGYSQQRRLVTFGGEYFHRLSIRKWEALYYIAQARPVVLEGDPVLIGIQSISFRHLRESFPNPQRVVAINHSIVPILMGNTFFPGLSVYGRQWTYSAGLNPLGLKFNLAPRRRLQPVLMLATGFLVSARDIPVDHSSSFNFSFELGGGFEWFYKPKGSLRFDYRFHHISSAYSGTTNPGIDSGIMQITYSFGR